MQDLVHKKWFSLSQGPGLLPAFQLCMILIYSLFNIVKLGMVGKWDYISLPAGSTEVIKMKHSYVSKSVKRVTWKKKIIFTCILNHGSKINF